MNRVFLFGTVVGIPTVRTTASGAMVGTLRLAVDKRFHTEFDEPDVFSCVAFGERAQVIGEQVQIGMKVKVLARLEPQPYQDLSGIKRVGVNVIIEEIENLSRRTTSMVVA